MSICVQSVCSAEVATKRIHSSSGLCRHVCSNWLLREKDCSALSRFGKGTEKEFFFGTKKLLFLDIH